MAIKDIEAALNASTHALRALLPLQENYLVTRPVITLRPDIRGVLEANGVRRGCTSTSRTCDDAGQYYEIPPKFTVDGKIMQGVPCVLGAVGSPHGL
jgi:hypothetical protein